jgi:hypothetical protein
MDCSFFDQVNEVVQGEPNEAMDPETLGRLASIGIDNIESPSLTTHRSQL